MQLYGPHSLGGCLLYGIKRKFCILLIQINLKMFFSLFLHQEETLIIVLVSMKLEEEYLRASLW